MYGICVVGVIVAAKVEGYFVSRLVSAWVFCGVDYCRIMQEYLNKKRKIRKGKKREEKKNKGLDKRKGEKRKENIRKERNRKKRKKKRQKHTQGLTTVQTTHSSLC